MTQLLLRVFTDKLSRWPRLQTTTSSLVGRRQLTYSLTVTARLRLGNLPALRHHKLGRPTRGRLPPARTGKAADVNRGRGRRRGLRAVRTVRGPRGGGGPGNSPAPGDLGTGCAAPVHRGSSGSPHYQRAARLLRQAEGDRRRAPRAECVRACAPAPAIPQPTGPLEGARGPRAAE